MVRPAPSPSGLELPPPRSHPHSVPEGGGLEDRGPRPAGTGGTAQRGTAGGPDAATEGQGALWDTRWRTHLSPAAAQPLRRGSTPTHRHAALGPALVFPGCGGGGGSGYAFSEPGPTARAARPPRPLPPAPAYRPLPPSGRKYRLRPPQTGTDVNEQELDAENARAQAQGKGGGGLRAGRLRTAGKFGPMWVRDVPRGGAGRKEEIGVRRRGRTD